MKWMLGVWVLLVIADARTAPAQAQLLTPQQCRTLPSPESRLACYDGFIDTTARQAHSRELPNEVYYSAVAALARSGLVPQRPPICVSLFRDDDIEGRISISVLEDHRPPCNGDPGVAPRRASLLYDQHTRRFFLYDVATDAYRPMR